MLAAILTLSGVVLGFIVLVFYLAQQTISANDARWEAIEAGNALLQFNFELQAQVRQATSALADKSAELDRAVAARKLLEKRHSNLVLRMTEGAPLDTVTEELQADLEKVHQLSGPLPVRLPLPLQAPPEDVRDTVQLPAQKMADLIASTRPSPPVDRITPVERPISAKPAK